MSINNQDFLLATREHRVIPASQLLNEATKRNYFVSSHEFKSAEQMFRGGEKLVDHVITNDNGSAVFYNPHDSASVVTRDGAKENAVKWCFLRGQYVLVNESDGLNAGDKNRYFDNIMAKEMMCATSILNLSENSFFETPNSSLMESDVTDDGTAGIPYSVFAWVTRDGLAPSSTNGGVTGSNWTTVQGINPTTNDFWRNQTSTYTAGSTSDPDVGVVPAFDEMLELTNYQTPDIEDIQNDPAVRESARQRCIITNRDGITTYKKALRALNDQMTKLIDPQVPGTRYEGISIKHVDQLNNVGWTAGQPDYLWLDFSVIIPAFRTGHYMREDIKDGGVNHPNKTVVYKSTTMNRMCRSRRRLGRISAA